MSDPQWRPVEGEFVSLYINDRWAGHRCVSRVTQAQARLSDMAVLFRARSGMWSAKRGAFLYRLAPAQRGQHVLREEHDAAFRAAALALLRCELERTATECTNHDRLKRALAALRGEDQ